MAILYGFAARCLFGVVFLHKAKQGRVTVCSLSLQISPASKNRAPIHHESAESLGHVSLLSLPLVMGIAMCYSWEMTSCFVVNANMDQSGDPGNQRCMTIHGSSYPLIVY